MPEIRAALAAIHAFTSDARVSRIRCAQRGCSGGLRWQSWCFPSPPSLTHEFAGQGWKRPAQRPRLREAPTQRLVLVVMETAILSPKDGCAGLGLDALPLLHRPCHPTQRVAALLRSISATSECRRRCQFAGGMWRGSDAEHQAPLWSHEEREAGRTASCSVATPDVCFNYDIR